MDDLIFVYGSLKAGFSNHTACDLGALAGVVTTEVGYPLVVPRGFYCSDPDCGFVHRYPALIDSPGSGHQIDGEVYRVDGPQLERLDVFEEYDPADESGSWYVRRRVRVVPAAGGEATDAWTYFIGDPGPYLRLLASDGARLVRSFTAEMDENPEKPCCQARPGHAGPHDVVSIP